MRKLPWELQVMCTSCLLFVDPRIVLKRSGTHEEVTTGVAGHAHVMFVALLIPELFLKA